MWFQYNFQCGSSTVWICSAVWCCYLSRLQSRYAWVTHKQADQTAALCWALNKPTNGRFEIFSLKPGYDEYSILDLYSGFLLLLVPYSENLLLDRVASNSKKATIFQLLDTDNNVFFLIKHFCKSAICVHLASWCLIFCEIVNISDHLCPPCWGFHERYQCLNFKTDSIAKIDSPIIMMMGAKNENQHQIIGLHTLLESTRKQRKFSLPYS